MTDMALLHAVLRVDFCAFIRQVFREVAAGEKYLPNPSVRFSLSRIHGRPQL